MAKSGKKKPYTPCSSITDPNECGQAHCSWNDFSQTCEKPTRTSCSALDPVKCVIRNKIFGDCALSEDGTCHPLLKGE